jgi:small glutamine-rich tetratricopeptide repeat-containing protein alpha
VFVAGFLFMGVGYGNGGFSILDVFKKDNNTTNTTVATDAQVKAALADLAKTPSDITKIQAVAAAYVGIKDYTNAGKYMEQAIAIAPTQEDLYLTLADIYSNASNYTSAVQVLNRAQTKFPNDPEVYVKLGLAERNLGNNTAAAMAWQKYLSLAPTGTQADTIRTALATLAASATTTSSTVATTSTTAGSTGTTASTTTTTVGATTTTSASTTTTAKP